MTQSIVELAGQNATLANGKLTITLDDLVDSSGNPYLATPAQATPAQAVAAWLSYLHHSTTEKLDENGSPIVDKTQAIVARTSFQPKSYEVREQESQVNNAYEFTIYTVDYSTFDPDNVV